MKVCRFMAGNHPVTVEMSDEEPRWIIHFYEPQKPDAATIRVCWSQDDAPQAVMRAAVILEHRFELSPVERAQLEQDIETVQNIVRYNLMVHRMQQAADAEQADGAVPLLDSYVTSQERARADRAKHRLLSPVGFFDKEYSGGRRPICFLLFVHRSSYLGYAQGINM